MAMVVRGVGLVVGHPSVSLVVVVMVVVVGGQHVVVRVGDVA